MGLWPKGAPNSNGDSKDKAELTVYLPDAKKATGRAVVCCPGGGYSHLAMDHEGHQWATFFNNQGIALIVLKYRMPHGNRLVPISDAEEAIKTVRKHATEWHIDRNNIGIMGFSAGGHLASTIATHSKGEAAPNFQILFYPVITMDMGFTHKGSHDNFLGDGHSKKELRKLEADFSNDLQVNRTTPRAFLALSDDDSAPRSAASSASVSRTAARTVSSPSGSAANFAASVRTISAISSGVSAAFAAPETAAVRRDSSSCLSSST